MTDLHSMPRKLEKSAMQYLETDRLMCVNMDIMVPELHQNGYCYIICYISLVRVWPRATVACQRAGHKLGKSWTELPRSGLVLCPIVFR